MKKRLLLLGLQYMGNREKGLVLTVTAHHDVRKYQQHGPSTELGSERTHRFGPGPAEPAQYPSRSQENQHRLGIKSEHSKQPR